MPLVFDSDLGQLYHGECLETLKELPGDFVDALVTDPPAAIAFMGSKWDAFPSLQAFQDFLTNVFTEAYRVLKPGAHALVWSLPKTSHHTAMALERAGFEMRDAINNVKDRSAEVEAFLGSLTLEQVELLVKAEPTDSMIGHLFGCLSLDTEVLTSQGWARWCDCLVGDPVLCYDSVSDTFSWGDVQHVHLYPYHEDAYHLVGVFTDQLLSRNHRCLIYREGCLQSVYAEDLGSNELIPYISDLSGLLQGVQACTLEYQLSGVLDPVWEDLGVGTESASSAMPCLRQVLLPEVQYCSGEGQILFVPVSRHRSDETPRGVGTSPTSSSIRTQRLDSGESNSIHPEDDRRQQPGVERRGDLFFSARELRFSKVCAMPGGLDLHGSEGWVCPRVSVNSGSGNWASLDTQGVCTPRQSQPYGQQTGEPGAICFQPRPQTVRASRYTASDLVRVERVPYDGLVWCVTVPTGAFVARRNDKVFVTGNSGFPKSLNVRKALDKSGSSEAEKWKGFGTALKPAVEIWWLARKPITKKSIVAQVLETGTGALNIDGCRVGTTKRVPGGLSRTSGNSYNGSADGSLRNETGQEDGHNPQVGRWPSNLTLQHGTGCKVVGTKTVKGDPRGECEGERPGGFFDPGSENGSGEPNARVYGDQEVPVYECALGCPVQALDEQSGSLHGAGNKNLSKIGSGNGSTYSKMGDLERNPDYYADAGGASRFFNAFESDSDPTFEPDFEALPFIYAGKASTKERNQGLEGFEPKAMHSIEDQSISTQSNRRCKLCGEVKFGQPHCTCDEPEWEETSGSKAKNFHPTLKSQKLMRHLVRLVTPPKGVVLDPFAGSGSTLVAAVTEGFRFIGVERNDDFVEIALARVRSSTGTEAEVLELKEFLDEFLPS